MFRPKALEIQSVNLKRVVEIQQEETEQTETEELKPMIHRSEQPAARCMIRIGASESILFNLRYLCYLLFQSAAGFGVNGKSGMELSLARSGAFQL
jgi:hypothetical protein